METTKESSIAEEILKCQEKNGKDALPVMDITKWSKKTCCDSEEYCGHAFGYDVCEHCKAIIERTNPPKRWCPKCNRLLRNTT